MKKVLIFAGHQGALGSGVHTVLSNKGFSQIILLSELYDSYSPVEGTRPDFADSLVVAELFARISSAKDTFFYLFSTIGGFAGGKSIWNAEPEDSHAMMQKNYETSYNLLREFSKLVEKAAGGSAVLISAWSAAHPEPNRAAYSSSKAALNHLIQTVALEGREINLSVCGLAPYLIDTPANREWMPEERWGTMQKPEEIGEFVHQVFTFSHILSGNIIELGERLQLLNFSKTDG
ncbi:MAG: hypothetical protein AMXMBFR48_01640 [Ignavibacteriales bacterium]